MWNIEYPYINIYPYFVNISNYHILRNADDDSTDTNVSSRTPVTITDTEDDCDIFSERDIIDYKKDNGLVKYDHLIHQNHDNHVLNIDIKCHSRQISESYVEQLIQCNSNIITDNNTANIFNSNDITTTTNSGKLYTKLTTNSSNIMTSLDSAAAVDDYTMEVPLLQQSCNNNNGDRSHNYNNKHISECGCLCQQKGFAFNLNNNATRSAKSKILWAIALCCIFMVVEFLGGYLARSLAIMTDAAHLASDCISFFIGLVAIWMGCKPPDAKMSFGYKRLEVMGAIVSILGIWILTATLVLVAIQRIYSHDYDLNANTMMTISGIGILINIIMIFILHTSVLDLPAGSIRSSHGHSHSRNHNANDGHSHTHTTTPTYRTPSNDSGHLHREYATRSLLYTDRDIDADVDAATADAMDTSETTSIELSSPSMVPNGNSFKHQQSGCDKNLNLRAAMIHVIGDLVQSFGVFLAAVLIKIFPKAAVLDPLCTLLFSIIVIMTTINLFKESMHLLMDSVPQGLSIDDLEMDLSNIEGVKSLHHLNVWNHTANYAVLMVHLVVDILADSNTVLMKATHIAESAKYNIKHCTIQVERVT